MTLNLNHEDLELIRTAVDELEHFVGRRTDAPLADGGDEPVSVDEYTKSHSQLFGLVKSAMRDVLAEHDASDEEMKIILERIENATRRLKKEIGSSTQLVAKLLDGERDARRGPIIRMEPLGEERETLAEASHPFVRVVGRGGGVETLLRIEERMWTSHIITSLLCVGGALIIARQLAGKGVA
ncbi:hypothetical protein [Bifidobacterium stellenboschense]|uniref:Uncharacterized protein n=1 Tax=Bifidobacterium stellenboschense TaxID=762211 RepID=A0A087DQQ1_9BIFI|nr:hypothetical protein [Bifidobacterium stellenboschense]KFI97851.1 hypothetical protein BSTEL_0662 [Bifidobacterium stellenboschense]